MPYNNRLDEDGRIMYCVKIYKSTRAQLEDIYLAVRARGLIISRTTLMEKVIRIGLAAIDLDSPLASQQIVELHVREKNAGRVFDFEVPLQDLVASIRGKGIELGAAIAEAEAALETKKTYRK
jgi:hypothetical protein